MALLLTTEFRWWADVVEQRQLTWLPLLKKWRKGNLQNVLPHLIQGPHRSISTFLSGRIKLILRSVSEPMQMALEHFVTLSWLRIGKSALKLHAIKFEMVLIC